ncbi:MAG TPA: oligosaccharide repeat unit polymerase [Bacteroidia bacterium]|nr:oligosaccharide repeat unit polymerase [Bacteroidia bacterium]
MNYNFDYFEVKYLFLFLTIYFIFIPFLFEISFLSFITILIVLIGSISFMQGYKTNKFFLLTEQKLKINSIFIGIGILFLLNDLIQGLNNLFSIRDMESYSSLYEQQDTLSLYMQIVYLSIYFIKYYLYALIMNKNKALFYLIFLSQIMIFFNSPTRLVALSPFIIFIIYGYYIGYIKINLFKIVIVFLSLPFLFVVLLLSRGKSDGMNYIQILENTINNLTLDNFVSILKVALESFKSFDDLTNLITTNFVHLESGIIRIIFMPISRTIWEDKPEPLARIIAKEFSPNAYDSNGGMVATIFGDAFVNGHVFGVIILLFILGAMSKIIYNTLHKNMQINKDQRAILIMFYSNFIFHFIYYMRGFFSDLLWKTLLLVIIYFVLYKLQYFISFKNKRRF